MDLSDDGTALTLTARGVELFRYTYRPDVPAFECPSPNFHPIRTLAGDVVTGYRPHDHRWHKGVAMTASHLSGQNFWGGVSWVRGQGYQVRPNVGSLVHQGFPGSNEERVDWVTAAGETWVAETRTIGYSVADDHWTLSLGFDLRNVRGSTLEFGSPTVFGRELAGYCGFFWRGPRDFTGGTVLTSNLHGDPMGQAADWLAFTGTHDEVDRESTLLFLDDAPVPDARWFVRSEPYPVVNPSLAFHQPLVLADGDALRLRYRLVVGNGRWTRDRILHQL